MWGILSLSSKSGLVTEAHCDNHFLWFPMNFSKDDLFHPFPFLVLHK